MGMPTLDFMRDCAEDTAKRNYQKGYQDGYANAIEDFKKSMLHKAKMESYGTHMYDGVFMEIFELDELYKAIKEVAEKLKGGAE